MRRLFWRLLLPRLAISAAVAEAEVMVVVASMAAAAAAPAGGRGVARGESAGALAT